MVSWRCFGVVLSALSSWTDPVTAARRTSPSGREEAAEDDGGESLVDVDADGVINENDECPWSTDYTSIDFEGCDDYQRDSDKDGVRDLDDDCENTPYGLIVNSNGCGDRDGDGITYDLDLCPDTPYELIKAIKPHTLVKGGDYKGEEVVGQDIADELKLVDFVDGKSSTQTIEKIKQYD